MRHFIKCHLGFHTIIGVDGVIIFSGVTGLFITFLVFEMVFAIRFDEQLVGLFDDLFS